MQKFFKLFVALVLAVGVFYFNPGLTNAEQGLSVPEIISTGNEERADAKRTPLSEHELLNRAAQMKADDMARYGYFSHTSPEGLAPWYWFKQAGYDYATAGENLAVNMPDAESTVSAWMKSFKHRANLLDQNYIHTGLGISYGVHKGEPAVFIVQLFGSPKNHGAIPELREGSAERISTDTFQANQPNVLGAHSSSSFSFLRLGSAGETTRELQVRLNQSGYNAGPADGQFGYNTLLAVMLFQKDKGLKSDGVVGPMTWAMFY